MGRHTAPLSVSAQGSVLPGGFSRYQKQVVAILAFLQFTIILDFMILSPLGAILMPQLHITPSQFGLVVSAYAFSAGLSGFLAAGFADRFDRKKMLLFFYVGFILGTLFCAVAQTYEVLLVARMVTGVFGGVIGSIIFAITTDLFPFEMRGRVMGVVQTAFAASQVMGIPFGLFLSNHLGWHAPFYFIVIASAIAGGFIWFYLKPINEHLSLVRRNPFRHLLATVSKPFYIQGFATTALLSTGGFMLMPFGSAFSVNNLGITVDQLPAVYLITGCVSILTGPYIGRLSDRLGKFPMFVLGSALAIGAILIYTRLAVTPLPVVILVSAILFMGVSARMISSQALMSAVPAPESRGAFMSVSASLQQVSGGIASILAGLIVVQNGTGPLQHFDALGNVVIGSICITVVMMYFIQKKLLPSAVGA